MPYNLAEAGAAVGRSKSSVLRAIRKGALSAERNATTGEWAIEPAELFRAYPPVAPRSPEPDNRTTRHDAGTVELREIRARLEATEARLADSQDQVADLRRRLDTATAQLGDALQQVRLLTDQRATPPAPPRRSWLPWRRRA